MKALLYGPPTAYIGFSPDG